MPCGDTSPVCGDVSGGEEGLHTGGPGAREILIVRCSAGHKGDSRQVWGPGEAAVSEESPILQPIQQPIQHTGMPVSTQSPLLASPLHTPPSPWNSPCYSRPRRRDTECRRPPSSPWQLYVPMEAKLALGSTRDPCWTAEPSGSAVAPARLHCTGELRRRHQAGCVRGQGWRVTPGPPCKPSYWINP